MGGFEAILPHRSYLRNFRLVTLVHQNECRPMMRITQPVPETFLEYVFRLLAGYDRKRQTENPAIYTPLLASVQKPQSPSNDARL